MDDGLGRDIGPDEVRLNHVYNGSDRGNHQLAQDDVEEDTSFQITHSINRRSNFRIQEPVDTTPDAVGTIYNGVFPPQRQAVPSVPDYYKFEANRLSTFSDWRYQNVVRKEDLAKSGFVYTGTGDKVRCVYCNGILRQWEPGDVVEQEHRRNFATCPFLSGQNVGNVPLEPGSDTPPQHCGSNLNSSATVPNASSCRGHDIDPIEEGYTCPQSNACSGDDLHRSDAMPVCQNGTSDEGVTKGCSRTPRNPQMAVEPDRLATFASWPGQMKQKPEDLAQAGLYYIGDGDKVKCFHCDGLLYNWDPDDDPFVEHAQWFPECQYIKLVKGEKFVDDVQNGRVIQSDVMQTPAVLAVLYEGHSVESVQRALAAMKKKNGVNTVVTAQNLLMTIMELEEETPEVRTQNGDMSPEALRKLQEENETLRDRQLCKVCMERDVEVIFLPCRHLVCCASCSAAVRVCPICRVPIDRVDKIYMV